MEKYSVQIDLAFASPGHITITVPLFSLKVPSEEEINQIISDTLNKTVLEQIVNKTVVIRL